METACQGAANPGIRVNHSLNESQKAAARLKLLNIFAEVVHNAQSPYDAHKALDLDRHSR